MLGGQLRAISLKDFRERMRVLAEELTRGGDPRIVLDRGLPVAILISFKEADTYARAEQGLAMLRGAGIYVAGNLAASRSTTGSLARSTSRGRSTEFSKLSAGPRQTAVSTGIRLQSPAPQRPITCDRSWWRTPRLGCQTCCG